MAVLRHGEVRTAPAVPMVLEATGRGDRVLDVYSSLLKHRVVFPRR